MGQENLISLYSDKLIALAASLPLSEAITSPDGSAKMRSPLCGSYITVSVRCDDDRIAEFSQDVKACALGQAAASVFSHHAVGMTLDDVIELRDVMKNMLTSGGPSPIAPFDDLRYLEAAKTFKNRHDSILLVFNATIEAMTAAQKKASA